jgi:hypothetical protein
MKANRIRSSVRNPAIDPALKAGGMPYAGLLIKK